MANSNLALKDFQDYSPSLAIVEKQSVKIVYSKLVTARMEMKRDVSDDDTTPPSLPLLEEESEAGDTEEVDCEAVVLALMHLRETGLFEE